MIIFILIVTMAIFKQSLSTAKTASMKQDDPCEESIVFSGRETPKNRFNEKKKQIQMAELRWDNIRSQFDLLKRAFTGAKPPLQEKEQDDTEDLGADTNETCHKPSEAMLRDETSTICLPTVSSSINLMAKKGYTNLKMEYDRDLVLKESVSLDLLEKSTQEENKNKLDFSQAYSKSKKSTDNSFISKFAKGGTRTKLTLKRTNASEDRMVKTPLQGKDEDSSKLRRTLDKIDNNEFNADVKNKENIYNSIERALLNTQPISDVCSSTIPNEILNDKLSKADLCQSEDSKYDILKEVETVTNKNELANQNNTTILKNMHKKENLRNSTDKINSNNSTNNPFKLSSFRDEYKRQKHRRGKTGISKRRLLSNDTASVNSFSTIPTEVTDYQKNYDDRVSVASTTKKIRYRSNNNNKNIFSSEEEKRKINFSKFNENRIPNSQITQNWGCNTPLQAHIEDSFQKNGELISHKIGNCQNLNIEIESNTQKKNTKTINHGEILNKKRQKLYLREDKQELLGDMQMHLNNHMPSILLNDSYETPERTFESFNVEQKQKKQDTSEKLTFNESKEENRSKIRTRGFELHTVSSKLKIAEKSYFQGFNFRSIPFVVGKATTPSHNLALNIQQTLSIIKMKHPIIHASSLASDAKASSPANTNLLPSCMAKIDDISIFRPGSSLSGNIPCSGQQRNSISCNKDSSTYIEQEPSHEWCPIFDNDEGNAISNRCSCYPRNCIDYHTILNQYLEGGEQLSYLGQSSESQQDKQPRQYSINAISREATASVRLTKVLRQIQMFQEILKD